MKIFTSITNLDAFFSVDNFGLHFTIGEIFFLFFLIVILVQNLLQTNIAKKIVFKKLYIMFIQAFIIIFFYNLYLFYLYFDLFQNGMFFLIFFNSFNIDFYTICSKLIILFLSILIFIMSLRYIQEELINYELLILLGFIILGMNLMIMSANFLIMFLAIEMQNLSFYGLIAAHRQNRESIEAALKYFILSSIGSIFILLGMLIFVKHFNTFFFNEISNFIVSIIFNINESRNLVIFADLLYILVAFLFITLALFFKLSIAPMHVWTPDVYDSIYMHLTAFMAVVSKVAFFLFFIKLYVSFGLYFIEVYQNLLLYASLISIFVGIVGSIQSFRIRRFIGYSSIVNMGFSLVALSVGSFEGIVVSLYYLIVYIFSNLILFNILLNLRYSYYYINTKGSIIKINNVPQRFDELKLLMSKNSFLILFITFIFFMFAGLPPFINFWTKFYLFVEMSRHLNYITLGLLLLLTVISSYAYLRVIIILLFEYLRSYDMNKMNLKLSINNNEFFFKNYYLNIFDDSLESSEYYNTKFISYNKLTSRNNFFFFIFLNIFIISIIYFIYNPIFLFNIIYYFCQYGLVSFFI